MVLAKQIGLQVDKAILVNDTMQTSFDPSIYAVGECLASWCTGIWFGCALIRTTVKVCAAHLAEIGIGRCVQKATATTLKVSGVNFIFRRMIWGQMPNHCLMRYFFKHL